MILMPYAIVGSTRRGKADDVAIGAVTFVDRGEQRTVSDAG